MKVVALLAMAEVASASVDRFMAIEEGTSNLPESSLRSCKMSECSNGEKCGYWIHNHDDRPRCMVPENCNTFGRLANDETNHSIEREISKKKRLVATGLCFFIGLYVVYYLKIIYLAFVTV